MTMHRPLFFLHIPRTGGTTVDSVFSANLDPSQIVRVYTKDEYAINRFRSPDDMKSVRYITGHLLLETYTPPKIYNTCVDVFTFLRNPLERLISEYTFYLTWPNQHLYKILNEKNISFIQYVQSREKIFLYRGKNFMTRCISGVPFTSGKHPIAALSSAKRQLDKNYFFFGIQEFFSESMLFLSDLLNFKNITFLHRNKIASGVKPIISENDKDIVMDLNKADFELYEFARDLFLQRIDKLGNSFKKRVSEYKSKNKEYQNSYVNISIKEDSKIILPKD